MRGFLAVSWQSLGNSFPHSRLPDNISEELNSEASSSFNMNSALRSVTREKDSSVSIVWPPIERLNL